MADVNRALSLSTAERTATLERFFHVHPGGGRPPPGLGRALIDFLAWEADSGRVADGAGSAWWKVVNGFLVLDLQSAASQRAPSGRPEGPSLAWAAYAGARGGKEQASLWTAHEGSIARGVERARPLLGHEEPAEQAFARLVLDVLRRATKLCEPTDTPALGAQVRRLYPRSYPISRGELEQLAATLPAPAGGHVDPGRFTAG